MKRKFALIVGSVMISVLFRAVGQITPQQAVSQMMRGINIGNTLEAPNENTWRQGYISPGQFDHYKNVGFTSVRIPITWDTHTSATSPYKIDPAWLARVEQVVDWGLSRGLFIIINAHHEAWLKEDTSYAKPAIKARFDSIWSQISVRFKSKSDHLLFEILNEPHPLSKANVDNLNARILSIIRQTNPTRLVIFSGNEYANSDQLILAAIPDVSDPYLVAYYHSYDPWNFAGLAQGTYGSTADISTTITKFNAVASWSTTHSIPVILSEWGAENTCDYNSRMLYYATITEQALNHGIAFNVWDDGGSFKTYDRLDSTWDDSKDVIINTYKESPTKLGVSVRNNSYVTISWTNRTTLNDSIFVDRKVGDSVFVNIAKIPFDSARFIDTLTKPNMYFYRLRTWLGDSIQLYSYPVKAIIYGQQAPFFDTAVSIPGIVLAVNYDLGGQGVAYNNSATSNQGGAYRNDNIGIEARTDSAGGYQLDFINTGEWLNYTVDVKIAQQYRIDTYTASQNGGGTFTISIGDSVTKSVIAKKTNSWQALAIDTAYLRLRSGIQNMRFTITNGSVPFNIYKFVIVIDTTYHEPVTIETLPNRLAEISLFPNPASNVISITGIDRSIPAQVNIFDLLGKKIKSIMVYNANQSISLVGLEKGIYLFSISQQNSNVVRKVIIR